MSDLREKLDKLRQEKATLKPPKLCKVCNRVSFLKCMECDTIYCSSKCQVKDWEKHQQSHNKASSPPRSYVSSKPSSNYQKPKSVQSRLQAAAAKEIQKVDIDEQIRRHEEAEQESKSQAEVDDVISTMNSVELSETASNLANSSIIEESIRKMSEIRKFRKTVELDPDEADKDGFNFVTVMEVEDNVEGMTVYHVMPREVKESYNAYKVALAESYNNNNIQQIGIKDLALFKKHLVMVKIDDDWVRATILNISTCDGIVGLEDIDSGRKVIVKMPRDTVKIPLDAELQKIAYSFKIVLENMQDGEKLDKGDIVKIRITAQIPFSFSWAEIKTEDLSPDVSPVRDHEDPQIHKQQKTEIKPARITIDQIQAKDLHTGPKVKLLYIDGSNIAKGILHVCESVPESWDFYGSLGKQIAEYMKENPCTKDYVPEQREMVLAKFSDGLFYRACCLEVKDHDAELYFIDYGSICSTKFADMTPMPAKFLHTSCSHSCTLKLVSGLPFHRIDVEKTNELLMDLNEFAADVEKEGKKFVIKLDDSLVVYQN